MENVDRTVTHGALLRTTRCYWTYVAYLCLGACSPRSTYSVSPIQQKIRSLAH